MQIFGTHDNLYSNAHRKASLKHTHTRTHAYAHTVSAHHHHCYHHSHGQQQKETRLSKRTNFRDREQVMKIINSDVQMLPKLLRYIHETKPKNKDGKRRDRDKI